MMIEEQTMPVSNYEIHTPKLYVAVYFHKDSRTPFGITSDNKETLLQSLQNWVGIDENKPVKIFTLIC